MCSLNISIDSKWVLSYEYWDFRAVWSSENAAFLTYPVRMILFHTVSIQFSYKLMISHFRVIIQSLTFFLDPRCWTAMSRKPKSKYCLPTTWINWNLFFHMHILKFRERKGRRVKQKKIVIYWLKIKQKDHNSHKGTLTLYIHERR